MRYFWMALQGILAILAGIVMTAGGMTLFSAHWWIVLALMGFYGAAALFAAKG